MIDPMSIIRRSHFLQNWLVWAALRHFLPASHIRELSITIVDQLSGGRVEFGQLFEDLTTEGPEWLGLWVVRPLKTNSALAHYLQKRVRMFVCQSDSEVEFFVEGDLVAVQTQAHLLEQMIALGSSSIDIADSSLSHMSSAGQESANDFVATFKYGSSNIMNSTDISFLEGLKPLIERFEMPLAAVVAKHFGDLCVDLDDWKKASLLYLHAKDLLDRKNEFGWNDLHLSLRSIVTQSIAAVDRNIESARHAASRFDSELEGATLTEKTLLLTNATTDSLASALVVSNTNEVRNRRTDILLPPLVQRTHTLSSALANWVNREFDAARSSFQTVLRRQIALGCAFESRRTKMMFAHCLLDALAENSDSENRDSLFRHAMFLLIESEESDAVKKIQWSEQLVNRYVDQGCVERVIAHAEDYSGARIARQMTVLALFQCWSELISPDNVKISTAMLRYITSRALEALRPFSENESTGKASLSALKHLGIKRPELRGEIIEDITTIITKNISSRNFFAGGITALEIADIYLDVFPDDLLGEVIAVTIETLEGIKSPNGPWIVIRPALRLLVSDSVKRYARMESELGRRIVSLIMRFGLEQENEQARLLFYLYDFDPSLLREESIRTPLRGVIAIIEERALKINSSSSAENINALLLAPMISGHDGVRIAFDAIYKTLNSARDGKPSVCFSLVYQPLMTLANEHQRIMNEIDATDVEFRGWMENILEMILEVWRKAKETPSILSSFSFFSGNEANPVVVHNWTFATIQYAKSLKQENKIDQIIDELGEASPLLGAIKRARVVRFIAGQSSTENIDTIRSEESSVFYLTLGKRLASLREMDPDSAREMCSALLDQCFRLGPNEFDAAILCVAAHLNMDELAARCNHSDYLRRLRGKKDLELILVPILQSLGIVKQNGSSA